MNLRAKLVYIPILIFIVTSIGLTFFSLVSFSEVLKQNVQENQKLLVESMVYSTDEFLGKYKDVITLTREDSLLKDISGFWGVDVKYRGLSGSQAVELRSLFKETMTAYPEFAYLETFTPDKAITVVLEPYEAQLMVSEEVFVRGFAYRDWYIGAIALNDTYISDAYVSASIMKPVTAIATPVFGDNRDVVSVFIGALELSSLSDMVGNLSYGETGITYIVDKNGSLVAHPDDRYFQEEVLFDMNDTGIVKDLKATGGKISTSKVIYDEITGQNVYVYYAKLNSTDWYIVSQQSEAEALGSVRILTASIGSITAVLVIIITAILFINARGVVKPLSNLSLIAGKISKNNLSSDEADRIILRRGAKRKDELGKLSVSFSQMKKNLVDIVQGISRVTDEIYNSTDAISERITTITYSSNEIDEAVTEITQSAMQQAEQTQGGALMTGRLNEMLMKNREKMVSLNESFRIIKESTLTAKENLDRLKEKNSTSNEVTYVLFDNVKKTDDSSKKISTISNVIASIADQTNCWL